MQVEIRADKAGKKSVCVSGYVNVVERESRVLHDRSGPYIEKIAAGAFAKAIAARGPIELRFNHRTILGSTEDKSVELREDNIGLRAVAPSVTDPAVVAAAEKQELRGWSFGFVKKQDSWSTDDNGMRHRTLHDIELREVSILDKTPAYIATSIETRGEDEILVEYRADVMVGDEGVDYARQTERKVEEETHTITGSDESMMFVASKTVEIYKMKRRMRE